LRSYGSSGVVEKIRAAGGEVYGVTSEPQVLADRAQEGWRLGFDCVGDPHHEITATASERGWLELFVQKRLGFLKRSSAEFDPKHPKGYFQPGVLVLSRGGRVLYRWRSVPSRKNVGGAMVRPTPEHVWSQVQTAMAAGEAGEDVAHDDNPQMDAKNPPWPLFVLLLIANGWFVNPVGFGQEKKGPTPQQRSVRAALRLVGFIALWVAAFATLPTLPVAAALVAWVAFITPKIRWLNLEFQNVKDA